MKALEQIIDAVRGGSLKSGCVDFSRLIGFVPVEHWSAFGFELKEGSEPPETVPFTRDAVLEELKEDVALGFEKALGRRGISASLVYETVKMWLWVLDDELQDHDEYPMYGLPLFKAVAVKYGFPNRIGDNDGDEHHYNCEYY